MMKTGKGKEIRSGGRLKQRARKRKITQKIREMFNRVFAKKNGFLRAKGAKLQKLSAWLKDKRRDRGERKRVGEKKDTPEKKGDQTFVHGTKKNR